MSSLWSPPWTASKWETLRSESEGVGQGMHIEWGNGIKHSKNHGGPTEETQKNTARFWPSWRSNLGRDWMVVTVVTMVPSGIMVRSVSTFLVGVSEERKLVDPWPPRRSPGSRNSSCRGVGREEVAHSPRGDSGSSFPRNLPQSDH